MVGRRVGPTAHKQDDREPVGPDGEAARARGPGHVAVTSSSEGWRWWWRWAGTSGILPRQRQWRRRSSNQWTCDSGAGLEGTTWIIDPINPLHTPTPGSGRQQRCSVHISNAERPQSPSMLRIRVGQEKRAGVAGQERRQGHASNNTYDYGRPISSSCQLFLTAVPMNRHGIVVPSQPPPPLGPQREMKTYQQPSP